MEGCLRYWFGALIFGGACTWRGLFSEFYGIFYGARETQFNLRKGSISHCNQYPNQ